MKACLQIALALVVFSSLAPTPTTADEMVVRQSRVRTVTVLPTPHRRAVCFDRAGQWIRCAESARVARQVIYDETCDGCPPNLNLSRYNARSWWWLW